MDSERRPGLRLLPPPTPTPTKPGKMMEEVSVTMQCDVYNMDQMSEEEILACLVADTEPKFTVRV